LIFREDGSKEIWEIKPELLLTELSNPAKIAALEVYAKNNGYASRVVILSDIENMEEQLGV